MRRVDKGLSSYDHLFSKRHEISSQYLHWVAYTYDSFNTLFWGHTHIHAHTHTPTLESLVLSVSTVKIIETMDPKELKFPRSPMLGQGEAEMLVPSRGAARLPPRERFHISEQLISQLMGTFPGLFHPRW